VLKVSGAELISHDRVALIGSLLNVFCRPSGTLVVFPSYPGLTPWADICRLYEAGDGTMHHAEFLIPSFEHREGSASSRNVPMQMNIKVRMSKSPRKQSIGRGTLRVRPGHPLSRSLIDFSAPNTATWDAGFGRAACGFGHCARGRGFLPSIRVRPKWLRLKAGSAGSVVKVETYAVGEMAPQWCRHKRQNPRPSRAWTGHPKS
jgi:hypothetical protein